MIKPFELSCGNLPLLVSMPHSGTVLTKEIARELTPRAQLLEDTDWHIPKIYRDLEKMGVSTLVANYSRYVVDLNRPADDKPLYNSATTGLFTDIFFDGEPLFNSKKWPTTADKNIILESIWQPYHDALATELNRLRDKFGYVILWDAHSIRSVIPRLFEGRLPDINFGTAEGKSCDPALSQQLLACCNNPAINLKNYTSVLNGRFKGGYITRHYGNPHKNIHAIQLEIAQCIYMNEETFAIQDELSENAQKFIHNLLAVALAWGNDKYS